LSNTLTVAEAAKLLGISRASLYEKIAALGVSATML